MVSSWRVFKLCGSADIPTPRFVRRTLDLSDRTGVTGPTAAGLPSAVNLKNEMNKMDLLHFFDLNQYLVLET